MPSEKDLKKDWEEAYDEAYGAWSPYLEEAKRDLEFSLGGEKQWNSQERSYLKQQRREVLAFNKIRRILNLITGYQRKNRLAFKVEPEQSGDTKPADQHSALLQHMMRTANGYHVMSQAFEQGPLKTGMNLVEVYRHFNDDPVFGDLGLAAMPYNRILLDPNWSKLDLSDCNYALRRDWLSKDQVKLIFPKQARQIEKMHVANFDNKFPYFKKSDRRKNLGRYDQFWRRESDKQTILVDVMSDEWRIWPGDADDPRLQLFLEQFPQVQIVEKYVDSVKLTVFFEEQLFYDGEELLGIGDYPFVPLIGFFDAEYDEHKHKLQGVVRCIRDPQKEVNKRRSKILDIIDSQLSSGYMAEEESVLNPADLYQSGQGKVIWTAKGALSEARPKVVPQQPPNIPQSYFQLQEVLDRDILEIPGANEELMGMPGQDNQQIAGILAKLRQSQGLTTLQKLFDLYRESKKLVGIKALKAIQNTYSPAKVQRILGESPHPMFFTRDFPKFDCTVQEGVLSDSQRQMYYTELVALKQMGAPIPWSAILEAAPLENKDKLYKLVAQEEQSMAQQMQLSTQLDQALTAGQVAKTREDIMDAVATRSEIQENQANALLDRIKAMKEIENMDVERLRNLADTVKMLEERDQQQPKNRKKAMTRR